MLDIEASVHWRCIESHGDIPHAVGRRTEAQAKRRHPAKAARRRVVEVCHRWFSRLRKRLVRYEKLERGFVAFNHIAAAIIAFRNVNLTVNMICGEVLNASGSSGLTSKEPAASMRATLPRASDYTRDFLKDWRRLSHPRL